LKAAMARNFYLTADAAVPREESLREDAYDRAAREARRFVSGGDRSYLDLCARLDELIAAGRRELAGRRVAADDIEAWDTSFRAMFLLSTWQPTERGLLILGGREIWLQCPGPGQKGAIRASSS
jgi:hypothetical protein